MRRILVIVLVLGAAAVTTIDIQATPASMFTGTTLATGRMGQIDVFNHQVTPGPADNVWISMQKTKGLSDVYVQNNVWQPGGSTGWHTHPGHSIIIVTAGAVTVYEGDDPTCNATRYTQGATLVDPGGDHVHLIRNEGTVPASTMAVQVIPAGAPRRIDRPDPGNCHF